MLRHIFSSLAPLTLFAAAILPMASGAQSQSSQSSQSQSVADAARRAREQKKSSTKPVKVITEDDLKPATPQTVTSAVATTPQLPGAAKEQQTPPEAAGAPAPASAPASESAEESAKKEADEKAAAELKSLKQQLTQAQKQLDLSQRELALARDTHYSNPDYAHDTAGKARLDSIKQQINDKQQDIERLRTRIAALEELVGRSAASAPAPAQP